MKPKNKGTKVLGNSIIDKLTRTHIAVPISLFTIYSALLLYYSIENTDLTISTTVVMFFTGLLAFTLTEYLVHRYVFHMDTSTEFRKKMQYSFHGVHHEYPKDKSRLAMPPVVSVVLATGLLFFFRMIMGDFVFSFLPGYLMGYAGYLLVHYIVHAFQPPKNGFKILWVHHGIHHYKKPDKAFGVSSPLWDYVFRTMP